MSCAEPVLKKKKKDNTMGEIIGDVEDTLRLPLEDDMKSSPDMFADCSPHLISDASVQAESLSCVINLNLPMEGSFSDSPDIFADSSPELVSDVSFTDIGNECTAQGKGAEHENNEGCSWRGVSIMELQGGSSFPQMPPVKPSSTHTVLFQVATATPQPPLPQYDVWDNDHVRMPFSSQSLYPITVNGDKTNLCSRWELVKEALSKTITSSMQLEAAILSYNSKYSKRWDFSALHMFFSDVLEPSEVRCFFSSLLPSIIRLALQLPTLVTRPIPLLRQHENHSISLNQLQIASLLANALLCTFPRRNTAKRGSEYASFPDINFNKLFVFHKNKSNQRGTEKLKCLFHYFRRVCHKAPEGVVTFMRRYIPPKLLPQWERSIRPLCKLHISSLGTIEDQGVGMLQMDFANKRVGGGVLGWGCVQEEIRFIICPELIIARLFTESLDTTESLLITGCERYSNYEGYADSFEWLGDHVDNTPRDLSGRMLCSIVAIDAMALRFPSIQFLPQNLLREVNKAYVGFQNSDIPAEHLAAVATGNWGCGAYRGNARLKALLQLMAAAQAGRHLAYFTFGDKTLRDDVFHMYTFLVEHQVTVGQLWNIVCQYYDQCYRSGKWVAELYPFLYQMIDPDSAPPKSLSKGPDKQKTFPLKNEDVERSPKKQGRTPPKRRDSPSRASQPTGDMQQQGARKKASNSGGIKQAATPPKKKTPSGSPERQSNEAEPSSSAASSRRGSLVDWLEIYDNQSSNKTCPVPRRKISDYFNVINVPK